MRKTVKTIQFRRRRKGKTDYRKRLKLLMAGIPRAVVRKRAKNIILQIVDYNPNGDITRVLINSTVLRKMGWKYSCSNTPSAYLAGLLAGVKAKQKNISKVVVDFGLQNAKARSKLYAAVKGITDAGIETMADEKVFPDVDRLSGKHIADYAKTKSFSGYEKRKADPSKLTLEFDRIKGKIIEADSK